MNASENVLPCVHNSSSAEFTVLKPNTTLHPRQAQNVFQHEKKCPVLILQHKFKAQFIQGFFFWYINSVLSLSLSLFPAQTVKWKSTLETSRKNMSSAVFTKVMTFCSMMNNIGPVKKKKEKVNYKRSNYPKSFHTLGLYLSVYKQTNKQKLIGI